MSVVCCLSVLLLLLPSCHRNGPVQGEGSVGSMASGTIVSENGEPENSEPLPEGTGGPSSSSTTAQSGSSSGTGTGTTGTIAPPSQQETLPTSAAPLPEGVNFESNLALGGVMAGSDAWTYLIDKTAAGGGVRFTPDFSHTESFLPGNCSESPCLQFAGGRIYYTAAVNSEYRLYSCDLSGNNPKDSGLRLIGGGIGFRILGGSVYYVNPESVLMKADLNGGEQKAILDLVPLKGTLATSRMAITEDSLFLMLTSDEKSEVDFYQISLRDDTSKRLYTLPFSGASDYLQFLAGGQTLIPYNGWLYFRGHNGLYKLSGDGKTFATIHVGNRSIDSMLIQSGKLYYMEDGCLYAISLDNDTVKTVAYVSLPFQHNGVMVHDYTAVRFLGSDESFLYLTRTQPLNVTEGSGITDSEVLIERISLDGGVQTTLFSSK